MEPRLHETRAPKQSVARAGEPRRSRSPHAQDGSFRADQLDIMVTVACNARCAFCVQEATFKPAHMGNETYIGALRRHMNDFHALGGRRVVITGGEPLLVLPRVMAVLKELEPYSDLEVKALYTNGSLLLKRPDGPGDWSVARRLAGAGLGCVNLSVHHYDESANHAVFGVSGKPRTEEIAAHLRECGLPFRLNLTLQKGLIDTAEKLERYARWGFALGAQDLYVRELFRYTFDEKLCDSERDPMVYSRVHAVPAWEMVEALLSNGDFRLVGDRREPLREKREWAFDFLPGNRRVFISSLEVGSESGRGYPYLVLMPDGNLYRGWLGARDRIERVGIGTNGPLDE